MRIYSKIPVKDRFNSKVEQVTETGCWLWTGGTDDFGYGQMNIDRFPRAAHRVSWELHHGSIPAGLCVLHKCDTPQCVNPDHLFLGTRGDNSADKVRKGRQACGRRLTGAQVAQIRADGRTETEVAKDFGIHQSQVSRIKTGQRWAQA